MFMEEDFNNIKKLKYAGEKLFFYVPTWRDTKEDVSDLLNGTKVLFKNNFNAQTRVLDAGGILIAQGNY